MISASRYLYDVWLIFLLLPVTVTVFLLSHLSRSLNLLEMAEGPGLDSNYIKVEAVEGEDPDLESGGYYFPRENFSNQFLFFNLKMIVKWFQNFLKMVYLFSAIHFK